MTPEWFPSLAPLPTPDGTRFRVVSRRASQVLLQLYDHVGDTRPARTLTLDGHTNRQGEVWEIFVDGVGAGQLYTWAIDRDRPLLDPAALLTSGPTRFGSDDAGRPRPEFAELNRDAMWKSVVVAPPESEDWSRPNTPWHESILYEAHVRGFSRNGGEGSYCALAAKADYLRDLGVTAVELLPVHEFDETEVRRDGGLFNYWGYSPIAWLSPQRRYAASADALCGPLDEFREMVRTLHAAGIEVILDVVFNHTGELDGAGPTWNLRGLDEELYYLHDLRTGEYADLTGCGNTVRAQHPTVRALIRDALRWWVHGMGVDGFRFDLASILSRDIDGELIGKPPLLREIEEDPWLRGVHLIAEAWDAAGGYQVADWPGGPRWAVWNDRFRDDVRRAWLAGGSARDLARRLDGSSDLFGDHAPPRSLNLITAHDGFTLNDVVSYERKHNEENGEQNRDGNGHEVSANFGHEGETDDEEINAARDRARRNLVATLLLAQGVPMLVAGDEFGRTQRGNNNAYCLDDERTWIDWSRLETDADFFAFVKTLIRLRRETRALRRRAFCCEEEIEWFGPDGAEVDWESGAFGYLLEKQMLVLVNLTDVAVTFKLPPGKWRRAIETAPAKGGSAPPQSLTISLRR